MPELPEVETIKRQLDRNIIGKRISSVIINRHQVIKQPSPERFGKELKGATIKNVIRKGKLLIFELSSGKSLTAHLKMTGQLIYPGNGKASRISFKFADGSILDYNDRRLIGELRLVDDWRSLAFVRQLGPEIFELTTARFKEMLAQKKTKIKPLLMEQIFISGVGNLYAAEALFRARIHPERQAFSLTEKEKDKLFNEIKDVLNEAILHKGSSVDQYVQLSGDRGGYVPFHKVYDREKKPCLECKTAIRRIALGGRGTYFCPKCQK